MYNNSVFKSTAVKLTTFNLQNVHILVTTFAHFKKKATVLKKQFLEEIFYLMVFLRNDIHFFLTTCTVLGEIVTHFPRPCQFL